MLVRIKLEEDVINLAPVERKLVAVPLFKFPNQVHFLLLLVHSGCLHFLIFLILVNHFESLVRNVCRLGFHLHALYFLAKVDLLLLLGPVNCQLLYVIYKLQDLALPVPDFLDPHVKNPQLPIIKIQDFYFKRDKCLLL